jgi:hypothetical protein
VEDWGVALWTVEKEEANKAEPDWGGVRALQLSDTHVFILLLGRVYESVGHISLALEEGLWGWYMSRLPLLQDPSYPHAQKQLTPLTSLAKVPREPGQMRNYKQIICIHRWTLNISHTQKCIGSMYVLTGIGNWWMLSPCWASLWRPELWGMGLVLVALWEHYFRAHQCGIKFLLKCNSKSTSSRRTAKWCPRTGQIVHSWVGGGGCGNAIVNPPSSRGCGSCF